MKYLKLLSLITMAICIISCGEDPVLGCTDPASSTFNPLATEDSGDCKYPGCTDEDADNYNAVFNEDDGSCTYFDRFLGSYSGTFECMGTFVDLLDEASSVITKQAGDNNQDMINIVVSNPATEIILFLEGVITKDEASINTFIPDFEYAIDVGGTIVEGPFEVTVTGTLNRMADNSLSGPISISIKQVGTPLGIADTCIYTAILN